MLSIVEMDENVTLREQMAQDIGPVFLINKFTVKLETAKTTARHCYVAQWLTRQHCMAG